MQFTYTADRGLYLSIAIALVLIVFVEGIGIDALIALLVHAPTVRFALLGLVTLLHLGVLGIVTAPLWTRHTRTNRRLNLRYGIDSLRIPRNLIVTAKPVREQLAPLAPLRAQFDAVNGRFIAAFSERGQVLLELGQTDSAPFTRASVPIRQVLINVDDRDTFLTQLGFVSPAANQDPRRA